MPPAATADDAGAPPRVASFGKPVVFRGMCDASGAVALGGALIAVGDDEDNVLRVFDGRAGGDPIETVDVSTVMQLPASKRTPELDIEAAARLDGRAFWLTSHGRDSKGKLQESRLRFFATTTPETGKGLATIGKPYRSLLDDLLSARELEPFGLAAAALLPPKEPGGLNIEGMTARPDGRSMLLGFRNPLPKGRALLVPLLNPRAVVTRGRRAKFGEPALVDLGGLGVRALTWWHDRYLIIAGGIGPAGAPRLFAWKGEDDKPSAVPVDWDDVNPEALVPFPEASELLVLSDDGGVSIDGTPCKRLRDPSNKRFRGIWLRLF